MNIVSLALNEDIGSGDKSAFLLNSKHISAHVITREECILFGIDYMKQCFDEVTIIWHYQDGDLVPSNNKLATLYGDIKEIVTKERTALNFLQTLSATATQTYQLTKKIAHTSTKLLDTRKTLPGLRIAQKQAVAAGGGVNHRMGLYDAIMLKENHLMMCSMQELVDRAQKEFPQTDIIIEIETLQDLDEADRLGVTRILCDNFSIQALTQAVQVATTPLEASGNITIDNIIKYAQTGVDYISIGSITKNINAIDFSLLIQ